MIKKTLHVSACFTCIVCNKDLSHDQFILDDQKQIFCSEDYAKKKAYRCTTCRKPIVPTEGQTKAPRLRAMGKDYHPDCFKCEARDSFKEHFYERNFLQMTSRNLSSFQDCGLVLDARQKGRECYPHKNHIFCLKCNRKKLSSDESSSGSEAEN